jgi:hypothetical protein
MLIRHADLSERRELNLLKRFAQTADPSHAEPELLAMASLGQKILERAIRERGDLTPNLRRTVGH